MPGDGIPRQYRPLGIREPATPIRGLVISIPPRRTTPKEQGVVTRALELASTGVGIQRLLESVRDLVMVANCEERTQQLADL